MINEDELLITDPDNDRVKSAFLSLSTWSDRRTLDFRKNRTPYRVLVAEFMLQQTQTSTMMPYFARFMAKWPTLESLADAAKEDVYLAFAGLGYYRRAGYLHDTVKKLISDFGGSVPSDPKTLLTLPGIGPYTANAIASIAFGKHVAAVDGNVMRIMARLLRQPFQRNNKGDLTIVRQTAELAMHKLAGRIQPGDINEALMDLSATVCKPKKPRCHECPLKHSCLALAHGDAEDYPAKKEVKVKPVSHIVYLLLHKDNKIWVRQRNESLLKNTYEFIRLDHISQVARIDPNMVPTCIGEKTHVFSHHIWQVKFFVADSALPIMSDGEPRLRIGTLDYTSIEKGQVKSLPFSSLFKMAIDHLNGEAESST